jgi:hypothetical protein
VAVVVPLFVALAVAALVIVIVVLLVQRGREGLDLSLQTLLRAYLYLGSFAAVVVLAFGLAALLNAALAAVAGSDFLYGSTYGAGGPAGVELERRRTEDLVRGVTLTVFGALFWLIHWLGRNRVGLGDQGPLQRAYFMIGTAFFGVATIVLLPTGVSQALATWLVPRPAGLFRPANDSLAIAVVSLVVWLLYLWQVAQGLPRGRWRETFRSGPVRPPERE